MKTMRRTEWWWVVGLGALWGLIIGAVQWWKWQVFGYNGLDLGIYTQVVWALSRGLGFWSSIHDPSYLGDHLELWLVPLAGIFRLFPTGLTLLWAQTVVIASSCIPLYLIARRWFSLKTSIAVITIWLAHPFLYNPALYEFHGLVFALPLLLGSILAYQRRQYGWWIGCLVLILAVREDMPLLVAGWAVLAAVDRRNWRWWLVPVIIAAAWWWLAQTIIGAAQPAGAYKFLAFYRWMGNSFQDILAYPFQHPWLFLQHVFQPRNWLTSLGLLLSFGFLPLVRWQRLLPLVFAFAQLLLIGAESDSILRLHYVIPYLPFLAWATLLALHDHLGGRLPWRGSLVRIFIPMVAVVAPLYAHVLYGPFEWPWAKRTDSGLTNPLVLAWGIQQVPKDAAVLTTFNLLPGLADRKNIYSLNYLHLGRRQYSEIPYRLPGPIEVAIIDWQQYYHYQFLYRKTFFQGRTGPNRLQQLLQDQDLHLTQWIDNLAIYTRQGQLESEPTEKVAVTHTGERLDLAEEPTIISIPNPLGGQQAEISLTWHNPAAREQPLSIRFTAQQADRVVWQDTRILGQGVHPSNQWGAGQTWRTRYRLALPDHIIGSVTIGVEVVELEGRMRLDRIRRFTPVLRKADSILTASIGPWSP